MFAFLLGMVANIAMIVFSVMTSSIANGISGLIFLSLNIRGYVLWKEPVPAEAV